jgi:hypothetical protein
MKSLMLKIIPIFILLTTVGCGSAEFGVVEGKKERAPQTAVPPPQDPIEAKLIFEATATPMEVKVGEKIAFAGQCSGTDKGLLTWDLKDTNMNMLDTFEHSYAKAGTYNVEVSCEAPGFEKATKVIPVIVKSKCSTSTTKCCCCCHKKRRGLFWWL